MAGVEQRYHYVCPSEVKSASLHADAHLRTSGLDGAHPWLFTGAVRHPQAVAAALLLVGTVARTRFYVPAASVARTIELADPVVTSHGDMLRFEALSPCCGVYSRLDLPAAAVVGDFVRPGTTNVESGASVRRALGQVASGEQLMLHVGEDEVVVDTAFARAVERRVVLPARWVKGLAEVQLAQQAMVRAGGANRVQWQSFLRSLPSRGRDGQHTRSWAAASSGGIRLSGSPVSGAVGAGGPERLRVLSPLAAFVTGVEVFGTDEMSGWVLSMGGGRLTLVLSPAAGRGFSGEGQVLDSLVEETGEAAEMVSAALSLDRAITNASLSARLGVPVDIVDAGLRSVSTSGGLGFDLAEQALFHRPLPLDAVSAARHPRWRDAEKLVDSGAVTLQPLSVDGTTDAVVLSGDVHHQVRLRFDGDRCTCPWFGRHRGRRGPCKHVLAVRLYLRRKE